MINNWNGKVPLVLTEHNVIKARANVPIQVVPDILSFPRVKQPGRKAELSRQSSAEF
jgi:hypothetical protein